MACTGQPKFPAPSVGGFNPATFAISLFGSKLTRFLNLELSALEADQRGKIISSPRVLTADQSKATIEQGTELPFQHWEKQSEAIRNLLGDGSRRMVSLDEIRLGFESFGLDKYQAYSFYRRRLEAMIDTLELKGLITRAEFEQELARVQRDWSDPCREG